MTTLKAEILTIGDELLRGDVTDTNATWLAEHCWQEGLAVEAINTVSDALEQIAQAVVEASHRCNVLLVSGGLGPTDDDRTSQAIAKAAQKPLLCNSAVLEALKERFKKYARPFTTNNEKQAFFPEGAQVLSNGIGTAPGFSVSVNDCKVYCMPGVPREMKQIFTDEITPELRHATGTTPAIRRTYKVFGLGESQIDDKLKGLLPALEEAGEFNGCQASLHYRTHFPENHVTVVVRSGDAGGAERTRERIGEEITQRLGHHIFSDNGASFFETIVHGLLENNATVATAESCTGGMISEMLTRVPGSSGAFHLGITAYDNRYKERLLHVPVELIKKHGAVSRQVVEAMAQGVRELTGSTYGIATSGIAGPGGGTEEKPVGTAHFALATSDGVTHLERFFPYGRERTKTLSAYVALWILWRDLHPNG
jgi:nicotinamide-nucleotide amidase